MVNVSQLFNALFLVALIVLPSCSAPLAPGVVDLVPRITTAGYAERRVEPNVGYINFAVQTKSAQAEKARDENAGKVTAIIAKLHELKVADDDLQTLDYHIQQSFIYLNGNSKPDGYEVVSRMRLKIADVKTIGKTIDTIVPLGANRIENIEFDVAERREIYKELLEEATAIARDKAARMAESAGIGKITVLEVHEEQSGDSPSPLAMRKFEAAADLGGGAATPIVGPTILKANVALTARAKN